MKQYNQELCISSINSEFVVINISTNDYDQAGLVVLYLIVHRKTDHEKCCIRCLDLESISKTCDYVNINTSSPFLEKVNFLFILYNC